MNSCFTAIQIHKYEIQDACIQLFFITSFKCFFFSFLRNPRRSRPREPIKTTVHFHLPPWASQQSQIHHFILDYVEPFQSWVAGFAKTAVGLWEHLEEGKMWGRLLHSSTLFYWKKQLRSSHVRQSKQRLTMPSTIRQEAFKWIFLHRSLHPSIWGSITHRSTKGKRSLCMPYSFDQTLPKMCTPTPTRSAFHYWLSHMALSSVSLLNWLT